MSAFARNRTDAPPRQGGPSPWVTAFLYAWLIVSAFGITAVAAPFVVPYDVAARAVPVCEAKRRGDVCSACGMTQAFYAIARGGWDEAHAANRGAIPVFAGLAANGLAAGVAGVVTRRRRS
jgi:hypothetical protein